MVYGDHINSLCGVVLLIPMFKKSRIIFCVKILELHSTVLPAIFLVMVFCWYPMYRRWYLLVSITRFVRHQKDLHHELKARVLFFVR